MMARVAVATLAMGAGKLFASEAFSGMDAGNAIERLTISGLLGIAVVVLYREIRMERAKNETREEELKRFVVDQTKAMTAAAQAQGSALEEMTTVLQGQQEAMREQVETYNKHIERIVEAATKR